MTYIASHFCTLLVQHTCLTLTTQSKELQEDRT